MQRLHVVGFTTDHEGLILSVRRGTRTGAFTVEVDANFEEILAELIKERGGEAEPRIPRAESQLSVREMQQRLRSGQSIHQVARAAGVNDEWVARFAVPIQAEQTQVIRQAFELTFSKQRLGVSAQPLGVSVWWNLQDRSASLDEEQWESGWTAFLVRDSQWVVRFEYETRKRRQVAEWEVDLRGAALTSRNRLATELGYVETGRRRRPGPPPPMAGGLVTRPASSPDAPGPSPESEPGTAARVAVQRRPAQRAVAKKAPARKKAVPIRQSAAKTTAAKNTAAKTTAAKTTAAKRPTPKKAAPKRLAAKKAAPRKAAAKKTTPRKAAAKKRAPKKPPPRKVSPVAPSVLAPRVLAPVPAAQGAPIRTPVVSAVRARETVPSERQVPITPPPAPSGSRRRFFGRR